MARTIAIIGAGPIGIEAAIRAEDLGWNVLVFERAQIGGNVSRWSHVRFFSPWELNRSEWGIQRLLAAGAELPPGDAFPTGQEFLDTYLRPLAATLDNPVREGAWVEAIGRRDALKGEHIGAPDRASGPFLLHVIESGHESYEEADVVFDTSGVYGEPSNLGPGGLPALGESNAEAFIERHIPDPLGADRASYAGKRVLVVGAGHSAVTSLKALHDLKADEPGTQISWLIRGDARPYERIENDPLPERDKLGIFGNAAAEGKVEGITPLTGMHVWSLDARSDGVLVKARSSTEAEEREFTVDRIVANVGYRPDLTLNRELQVHQCYASEGPMKLAASLLAASGGSADCLDQESAGVDVLKNPEPDFYVLGHKSYGRNSAFLLKVGHGQIREVLDHLGHEESDAA